MRAVCRYSSRRCADSPVPAITAAVDASTSAALAPRKLCPVVVSRLAIDRVNVIDTVLRRVFDDERRSLDAEVRRAAVADRSAPGEIGVGGAAADFRHP